MQRGAGPEWDHIDQTTLEEVEKSWAHSRCREVEFDISGMVVVSVCACACREVVFDIINDISGSVAVSVCVCV